MSRRIVLALLYAPMLACSSLAGAAPEFAPNPRQAFDGFVAINPPRAAVPVGALWIDGFGPTGEAAAADNLETVRSLNTLTIDKNLQLALNAGLLSLIGIDPKLRDHYVARFSDLSIVRVKDISKLAGIKGEPRIVEALKAGSVTISSDRELGLNAQLIGFQNSAASGSTTNDRARTYSIEARDMFIAIHVATPELVASEEREVRLNKDGRSAKVDDYLLIIGVAACTDKPASCRPPISIAKPNSYGEAPSPNQELGTDFAARLLLPVPTADGHGGLFDSLLIRWIAPCEQMKIEPCREHPQLFVRYAGTRLADADKVKPTSW